MRWCGLDYSGTRFSEHTRSNEICGRHEKRMIFIYVYSVSQEEVNLVLLYFMVKSTEGEVLVLCGM
jgi:hypothetical protein